MHRLFQSEICIEAGWLTDLVLYALPAAEHVIPANAQQKSCLPMAAKSIGLRV